MRWEEEKSKTRRWGSCQAPSRLGSAFLRSEKSEARSPDKARKAFLSIADSREGGTRDSPNARRDLLQPNQVTSSFTSSYPLHHHPFSLYSGRLSSATISPSFVVAAAAVITK